MLMLALAAQAPAFERAPKSLSEWEMLTHPKIWGATESNYPEKPPIPSPSTVPNDWLYLPTGRFSSVDVLHPWILDPDRPSPQPVDEMNSLDASTRWLTVKSASVRDAACAFTEIVVPRSEVCMARLSGAKWMLVNDQLFTGDPERRGYRGVPVALNKGRNRIFVCSDGATFDLELWKPTTPAVIEAFDIQWPSVPSTERNVWFPIFNATENTIDELHVHYGHAVHWSGSCRPVITDWACGGYVVPLGMQLGETIYSWPLTDCEKQVSATDRDICFPLTVYTRIGFADRRLLRRQVQPNGFVPNNFETVARTRAVDADSMAALPVGRSVQIVPTAGSPELNRIELGRARFSQFLHWYQAGDENVLVHDAAYLSAAGGEASSWLTQETSQRGRVVLYGNADTNRAWTEFVDGNVDFDIRNGHAQVGEFAADGDDLAGWHSFKSHGSSVLLIFDTGPKGARLGALLAAAWKGKVYSSAMFRVSDSSATGWVQVMDGAPKPIQSLPPLVEDAQAVSPDHTRIAISTRDEGVWIVDIATKVVVVRIPVVGTEVQYITWNSEGSALALLRRSAFIDVVDAATGEIRATLDSTLGYPNRRPKREIHFAAGDSVIVAALGGWDTDILPAAGGERIARIPTSAGATATAYALSRDGELLALGDKTGTVSIWNARTGQRVANTITLPFEPRRFVANQRTIHALDFNPSGDIVAIGSASCSAKLWNRKTGELTRTFSHCDADIFGDLAIGSVQFNHDGTRLLTASFPYWELRTWDISSGSLLDHVDFSGGNPPPMPAWFSSDGRFVVASLACRTAPVDAETPTSRVIPSGEMKLIPGGYPKHEEWAWFQHEGDYAWAVVDDHLVVRKIPDAEPILKIPVREK